MSNDVLNKSCSILDILYIFLEETDFSVKKCKFSLLFLKGLINLVLRPTFEQILHELHSYKGHYISKCILYFEENVWQVCLLPWPHIIVYTPTIIGSLPQEKSITFL